MALSGGQITRVGDIGFPGRAYLGFVAKALSASAYPPVVTILALPYVGATIQAFSAVSVTIQAYPAPDENIQAKSAVMVEINTSIHNQWVDARISTGVYTSDVYEPDVYE